MVNVRNIRVEDWDNLKDMLQDLVKERPPVALELEPLINKGDEWIAQFPRGDLGKFLVAEHKGKIIGFCYLAVPHFYKPMCYIGIAVRKAYRKKDIGTQLFYEAASWAVSKHLQYIIADVWDWNTNSVRFFTGLRFVERDSFQEKFKGEESTKIRLVKKL
jgi:GNAT superfamily N-acetyltransferase